MGKDSAWGRHYMKHTWLSVGWTHVANTPSVLRPDGIRLDALGRRDLQGPKLLWTAPVP